MFPKRKRTPQRGHIRMIEAMLVLVMTLLTVRLFLPSTQPTSIPVVIEAQTTHSTALIDASYQAAQDYIDSENYAKAAVLLDAITTESDHYDAHVSYSFVLYQLGAYDHAITIASDAIIINPNKPAALSNRCLLLGLVGNPQAGLADCNQAVQVDPQYAYGHNNQCYILSELGQLQTAERACNQALMTHHRQPEWVYTNLGHIALKRGMNNAAIDMFTTALNYNPTHADAYAGLGDVLLIQSDFRNALESYRAYHYYAGVHYDASYDAKFDYALHALTYAGQN